MKGRYCRPRITRKRRKQIHRLIGGTLTDEEKLKNLQIANYVLVYCNYVLTWQNTVGGDRQSINDTLTNIKLNDINEATTNLIATLNKCNVRVMSKKDELFTNGDVTYRPFVGLIVSTMTDEIDVEGVPTDLMYTKLDALDTLKRFLYLYAMGHVSIHGYYIDSFKNIYRVLAYACNLKSLYLTTNCINHREYLNECLKIFEPFSCNLFKITTYSSSPMAYNLIKSALMGSHAVHTGLIAATPMIAMAMDKNAPSWAAPAATIATAASVAAGVHHGLHLSLIHI